MRKEEERSTLFPISEKICNSDASRLAIINSLPISNDTVHPLESLATSRGYGLEDLALAIYRDPYFETSDFQKHETFEYLDKNALIRSFVRAYTLEPENRSYDDWARDFPPPKDIERICIFLGLHPADILPKGWGDDPLPPNLLRLHMQIAENTKGEYKNLYQELSDNEIHQERELGRQFCSDNLQTESHSLFQAKVRKRWEDRGTEEVKYDSLEESTLTLTVEGDRRYLSDIFEPFNNGDACFAFEEVEEEQFPRLLHYFEQCANDIDREQSKVDSLKKQKILPYRG